MLLGLTCIACVLLLAFLRIPLAFSLLTVSVLGMATMIGFSGALTQVSFTISEAVLTYELAVIPLFMLMGNVTARAGISDDLFNAANTCFGSIRGSLAFSTMVACGGFSAVCGSSMATAATMSKVAYPSMKKFGYSDGLSSATIAAGGTLGILIPPSVVLILYGLLTETSIGKLFVAGVIPGLVGLLFYLAAVYFVVRRNPANAPRGEKSTMKEKLQSLSGVWPFLLLFVMIIGGLYIKLFTPTEAAGMGSAFAIILAFLRKRINFKDLQEIVYSTALTTVSLYTVIFGAFMFAKLISFSGLAEAVLLIFDAFGLKGVWLILAIFLVFIALGCVMDSIGMILICIPLFAPIIVAEGYDLIWFGIVVVVATEIALITPPIGMNVFVLKATLPKVPMATIFRGIIPFVAVDVVRLLILILFPAVALWLPSQMQ